MSAIEFHSALCLGDCPVRVLYRFTSPATLIVFRGLKLSPRSPEMFQRAAHVRLIGAGRDVKCTNCS